MSGIKLMHASVNDDVRVQNACVFLGVGDDKFQTREREAVLVFQGKDDAEITENKIADKAGMNFGAHLFRKHGGNKRSKNQAKKEPQRGEKDLL